MLKNESMLDGSERVQDIVDFIFNLPLFEFLETDELQEGGSKDGFS